ncbi:MAG: hypothetical protein NZ108_08165, partial [Bacteroidia bacterium]|nr:hypothetical protein [Bacteroidia bacterium]
MKVPDGTVSVVTYQAVAKAGDFSDGEEATLPVLSDRMLVTETFPLPIRGKTSKKFRFEGLAQSRFSSTVRHQNLTLEFTPNPIWYAVQALPYLMEYPYECAEQVFSRYYANTLASYIANSNPKIKQVFDQWKNTDALLSNLQKNQELKNLLLEETPWVLQAQSEEQQRKNIGLLFDLNRMANETDRALDKLAKMQGVGFPWFPGMEENWYITQHIVAGFGHLQTLNVIKNQQPKINTIISKAVQFIDAQMYESYQNLKRYNVDLNQRNISYIHTHYLYARSFFLEIPIQQVHKEAFNYWKNQAEKYWLEFNHYCEGLIALGLYRLDAQNPVPKQIITSLRERAIENPELGMYWKLQSGFYWQEAPIETHALLIEAFSTIAKDVKSVDAMKTWLLKNKQTTHWKTTKATTDACYALLLEGTHWLNTESKVEIEVGGKKLDPKTMPDVRIEAGTGYFKTSWKGKEISEKLADITITKSDEGVSWGAMYWQYFENIDKIKAAAETPLKIKRELYLQKDSDTGPKLTKIEPGTKVSVGDLLKVRIEIRTDRAMEYVHLKDMRASGLEPVNVLSRYKY